LTQDAAQERGHSQAPDPKTWHGWQFPLCRRLTPRNGSSNPHRTPTYGAVSIKEDKAYTSHTRIIQQAGENRNCRKFARARFLCREKLHLPA